MRKTINYIGYRTIKTAIGAALAMLVASSVGLKYSVAAGIIVILSVQSTKRKSIQIAYQRMCACLLALFISTILFNLFGYSPIVFGIFLLLFIPLSARFRIKEGIVVSSVLVTHLLVEKSTSISLLINEFMLMIVGVGIALLLNLYMPSIEKNVKEDMSYIENLMKEILFNMSAALRECAVSIKEEELINNLEKRLITGRKKALKTLNNSLISDNSYYVKYMDMRTQQLNAFKNMRRHFDRFSITYKQTEMIAEFTLKLSESIHEYNTADGLLKNLQALRESFKDMELPKTREEFENRAMLFQFLNDLEQFLLIKNEFKDNIKNDNIIDVY